MDWEELKTELYKKNRVAELHNKNTKNELMVLWNGWIVCKTDDIASFKIARKRAAKPNTLVEPILISPPKNIYDYGKYANKIVGYEYPPDELHQQPYIELIEA